MASLIEETIDFTVRPMRESFIPPAVLPLEPPTAIRIARIRIAPEENTVRTWLVVTTEKPVVLEAEMSMNTPRRIIVSRSEKSGVVERVAMKMMHMNTSQKNQFESRNP